MEEVEKMKHDCSKTIDYMKERKRMCAMYPHCKECPLIGMDCVSVGSIDIVQKWSDEHPEPPKLTKRERDFLDCFNPVNKYIKRQYGVLTVIWKDPTITLNAMEIPIDVTMFKFVEKGQKWSFDDLRKLEVEE